MVGEPGSRQLARLLSLGSPVLALCAVLLAGGSRRPGQPVAGLGPGIRDAGLAPRSAWLSAYVTLITVLTLMVTPQWFRCHSERGGIKWGW